ncbi:hypothetical protein [Sulfobacillus thermosulfidooxidans]|uniref:hypothetical protein n=1 Tax=Sulfobacillus thermosulfidooxidans TaxID=28034 RepID=UPI001111EE7E|nr:hypothetical protein [Sulfobacillus thermosulfidooxidans]
MIQFDDPTCDDGLNALTTIPPLDAATTRQYLEAAAHGDQHARALLIRHNLRLVAHIAQKYRDRGLPWDDLFQ